MHRPHFFDRGRKFILGFVNRPWYPALIALLALLDLFIVIVPTDVFLISAVMGQPRRWFSTGITIALGSIIGSALLAFVLDYDQELIHRAFPAIFTSSSWNQAEGLIENYGVYATFFAAVGPLPLQPFIVVGALSSKLTFSSLILSVAIGRLMKFSLFAWLASHAPRMLEKLKIAPADEIPATADVENSQRPR